MTYQITTDPHEAAINVSELLSAIPTVEEWDAVRLADELAEIMFLLDAVPPEIEAAFNAAVGRTRMD